MTILRLSNHCNLSKLHLDWASHKAAKYACQKWHYSGTIPRGKLVKVGVWEDGYIGVVVFSMGASPFLNTKLGVGQLEVCELTRVALRQHQAPVSRIVRIALKLLRQHCPGIKVVVSFADPHHGHVGGIYQALGWAYTGKSAPTCVYRDKRGRVWHDRNISPKECRSDDGWATRKHSPEGMTKEKRPGKHRYVWAFDSDLRKQLESTALDYPKSMRQK